MRRFFTFFFFPTRSRRDIRENSKAPTFPHWIRTNIGVPDQGENWWRQCWRHKRNIDISFIAQFATHQEIWAKDVSILKSSSSDSNGITAMPRPILISLLWNFNPVFEPHVQKYWPPALFFFFFFLASFDRFCIFCFLDRLHLCRKKKKRRRAGGQCVD